MKYGFNKLKMDIILKIIQERGYYYIQTEKLYDNFTGPRYIVITDDPDFAKKHPRLAKMIIMTPEEFEPMIAICNEWLGNERLADDRQRRYHNDEGYYEDCDTDEEGNGDFLKIKDLPLNPVLDEIEEREFKKMVREAMATLNAKQYQRIYCYYFKGMTHRQIAALEGVADMTIRESIDGAMKKMKKFFEKYPSQNAFQLLLK